MADFYYHVILALKELRLYLLEKLFLVFVFLLKTKI
jgi:hypothetical protein